MNSATRLRLRAPAMMIIGGTGLTASARIHRSFPVVLSGSLSSTSGLRR
jgi:hypothetical protein